MRNLPSGTTTFLFSDIEGSTRLLRDLGATYDEVLADHQSLLRSAWANYGGQEVGTEGDSFFVAFERASDAVRAALTAQRALCANTWPHGIELRVRMGLHTGEARIVADDYVGLAVHQAARISAAAHGGQVLLSRTTHDLVAGDLPPDTSLLDLGDHHLKDLPAAERLFQLRHPDLPGDFPPLRSLDVRRHNLPAQLTSFIGRDTELAELRQLISNNRLVTLTGAGGSGKTRLALEVAAEMLGDFADGVRIVDFAPISDPDLVGQAVASSLGLREQETKTIESVLEDYFVLKDMLLIADNCEHLVRPCADLLERLIKTSPRLKILVTTREPLGVHGEVAWRVPSLDVPDPKASGSPEELMRAAAVRLFVDRAASVDTDFSPGADDLAAIARICQRLDGIPLAIELAAARTEVLTPQQIVERLNDRFRLLTGGRRTALARQQTLRALVDWSYDLLDVAERTLLDRISVFAGGATLDAIETVCAGGEVSADEILDLISQLVRKSLVLADKRSGEVRYRLLETIRQYGLEKLLASPEASSIRAAHRDFYLARAEDIAPNLAGSGQREALNRLERDYDNYRAAIEWSLAEPGGEAALRLTFALWHFWRIRGQWTEGRNWYAQALEVAGNVYDGLRAKALCAAGFFAAFQSDYDVAASQLDECVTLAARVGDRLTRGYALWSRNYGNRGGPWANRTDLLEEALQIGRELDDKQLVAWSLLALGSVAFTHEQNLDETARLMTEALTVAREADDPWNTAMAVKNLGGIAHLRGDIEEGRVLAEEALHIWRDLGDKFGVCQTLQVLGGMAVLSGDVDAGTACLLEAAEIAREVGSIELAANALNSLAWWFHQRGADTDGLSWSEESVQAFRVTGYRQGLAASLHTLGEIHRSLGDHDAADSCLKEALTTIRDNDTRLFLDAVFAALAGLATMRGQHDRAAYLFGATEALRASTDTAPEDLEIYQRDVAVLRAAMDASALDSSWERGRSAPVEESISFALTED